MQVLTSVYKGWMLPQPKPASAQKQRIRKTERPSSQERAVVLPPPFYSQAGGSESGGERRTSAATFQSLWDHT